jgi:succinate dehydrogenase/fumarate reductase-like Fe-S protein
MKRRILAWINLAYRFNRHVLTRMPLRLLRGGRDFERFVAAVTPEGYLPLTSIERDALPDFMRCIQCGLCALACPALAEAPASAWDEAWTFVAGPSRSIDRAALVAADAAPCTRCDACDAICPTGVPITLLAGTLARIAADARDV